MKKKVLIFDYEQIKRVGQLLNVIKISGVDNVRVLAEISYILDSGELSEIEDIKKKEEKTDVHSK